MSKDRKNKDALVDEDIDLSNDDYDVELESASEDEDDSKKLKDDKEKTVVKSENERKIKKKKTPVDSDEELSDDGAEFQDDYIDTYTADQYKLELMNPQELTDDMKALPKVYRNKISTGPTDYIKFRILEKHKGQDEYIVPSDKRKTSHILQKAERTELLGIRAEHISRGAEPYVDIINETDSLQIARKELREKKFPLLLKRSLNSFESEVWNPNEMTIIWDG